MVGRKFANIRILYGAAPLVGVQKMMKCVLTLAPMDWRTVRRRCDREAHSRFMFQYPTFAAVPSIYTSYLRQPPLKESFERCVIRASSSSIRQRDRPRPPNLVEV